MRIACPSVIIFLISTGKARTTGSNSNGWRLKWFGGFFTHLSGSWTGKTQCIGLAESVEQTSPFGLAYSCHGLFRVVRFLMWIHVSKSECCSKRWKPCSLLLPNLENLIELYFCYILMDEEKQTDTKENFRIHLSIRELSQNVGLCSKANIIIYK